MKKSKTQAQLDQAADKLLRQKYGVGLDWYNAKFKEQGGCAICGDHGKTRRLNVDHDHHWVDVKIVSTKNDFQGWDSEATYRGVLHCAHGASKSEAIREMKAILKRESVRGLLCHRMQPRTYHAPGSAGPARKVYPLSGQIPERGQTGI